VSLQASVSAGISIGEIQDIVDGAVDKLRPQSDPRPLYFTRAQAQPSNGGIDVLVLGAPPTGSIWQCRFITAFGVDWFTPIAGAVVALFAGDPTDNPSLAQILVTGTAVPATTYIPDTTMWCHPNQNLFALVKGGTAGVQIGCVVGIEEWHEWEVSRNSGR
jgi:hypothetical protein